VVSLRITISRRPHWECRLRSGGLGVGLCSDPIPRQQFIEARGRMPGNAGEHVGKLLPWKWRAARAAINNAA